MKNILLIMMIFLTFSQSFSQVKKGLVAKYSFNAGNVKDEIGNCHGKNYGATLTTDRFGNANKAYQFMGGTYITLPDSSILKNDTMTVSLWVKVINYNSAANFQNFIYSIINSPSYAYFSTLAFSLNTYNGKYFTVNQNDMSHSVFDYSLTSVNFKWQHYVIAFDDDSLYMFLEGKKQWSKYKGFKTVYTKDPIYIGISGNTSYQGNLNGCVDDIRVYNRVLSSIEVDSLFQEKDPKLVTVNKNSVIENKIQIYPTSVNDVVNFSESVNVELIDISGRVIVTKSMVNFLDMSAQPVGIYFINIKDQEGNVQQRSKVTKGEY